MGMIDKAYWGKFVGEVNRVLRTRYDRDGLTPDEEVKLAAHVEEFEAAGDKVWDGTRGEHYAKWLMNVVEKAKNYSKTYTSFSGADIMYVCNRKIVGEVQQIFWKIHYPQSFFERTDKPLHGRIITTVYNGETGFEKAVRSGSGRLEIAKIFQNEYGQRALELFVEPQLLERSGGTCVDMTMVEDEYLFVAKDILRFVIPEGMPTYLDDMSLNPDLFTLPHEIS